MTPDELTPAQTIQVIVLGGLVLCTLVASALAYGIWFYKASRGVRFQLAKRPLATVGLIDCLFAVVLFFTLLFSISLFVPRGESPTPPASIKTSQLLDASQTQREQEAELNEAATRQAPPHPADTDQNSTHLDLTQETSSPSDLPPNGSTKMTADTVVLSAIAATMQLIAVGIVIVFIRMRTGCPWDNLGIPSGRIFTDIATGIWLLFLMIPILMVFSGVVNALSGVEYKHPVIEMMKEFPWLFGLVAWMAVIVAPISEEFLFRTLLIGWFESAHFGKTPLAILLGWMPPKPNSSERQSSIDAPSESSELSAGSAPVLESERELAAGDATPYTPPWWPSIVSGGLFGIAHLEYGLSWIPLVFFGIFLGRVYQLRQSLITCVAIHLFFNAINVLILWLSTGLDLGSK